MPSPKSSSVPVQKTSEEDSAPTASVSKDVFEKRIGELTKRYHQAEARASQLEGRLGQSLDILKQMQTQSAPANGSAIRSSRGYTRDELEAVAFNDETDASAKMMAQRELREIERKEDRDWISNQFEAMNRATTERSSALGAAAQMFPELGDPSSKLYAKTNELMQQYPDAQSNPKLLGLVAGAAFGELARDELPTYKASLAEKEEALKRLERNVHPDRGVAGPITDEGKSKLKKLEALREKAYGDARNATDDDRMNYIRYRNELAAEGIVSPN